MNSFLRTVNAARNGMNKQAAFGKGLLLGGGLGALIGAGIGGIPAQLDLNALRRQREADPSIDTIRTDLGVMSPGEADLLNERDSRITAGSVTGGLAGTLTGGSIGLILDSIKELRNRRQARALEARYNALLDGSTLSPEKKMELLNKYKSL